MKKKRINKYYIIFSVYYCDTKYMKHLHLLSGNAVIQGTAARLPDGKPSRILLFNKRRTCATSARENVQRKI